MKFCVFGLLLVVVLAFFPYAAIAQPPDRRGGGRPSPESDSSESLPPIMSPEQLIRQFDRDGDGRISRDEAPPRMRERWDQIDMNRDGSITREELQARDDRVQHGGGPPQGRGEPGRATPARAPGGFRGGSFQPVAPFSVIIVGSGSPQYAPDRSSPSALIQYQGRFFLVDMGNGTQARLNELGLIPRQIEALLLTHHHLDHNEEFGPLLMHTRLMGARPEIVGPPTTQKLVDFTLDFYAEDIAYRLGRLGRTMQDFDHPTARELQGGEHFALGGMQVSTTRVNHTIHTVAYRFDAGGQSIVISGDLSYTESLIDLAHGADVLVIDSGAAIVRQGRAVPGGRPGGPGTPSEVGRSDGVNPHGSFEDVVTMARKSGAKRLVLTHIAPGEVDEAATMAAIKKTYSGEVIVACDLLEIPATGQPRRLGSGDEPRATDSSIPAASAGTITVPAKITGSARVYVRAGAPQSGDGASWVTALPSLQAAIDRVAQTGGGQVWVAQGTYAPGNDRDATFQLRSGVAVYGGFAGTETRLEERDVQRNVTTLSGVIDTQGAATDHCYHVVTGADNTLLDGFLITGGDAREGGPGMSGPPGGRPPGGFGGEPPLGRRGPPGQGPIHTTPDAILAGSHRGFGGGMLNFQCAPTVRNCTFQGNQAGKGGAVYNMISRSFPPPRDAEPTGPLFVDCRFLDNQARGRGGAVANDLGTSPTFRGCTWLRNVCEDKGGAVYNDFGCSPTLVNCLLAENRAVSAAAIGNDGGSSPRIIHCTLSRNVAAEEGAALYQGTGPANCPLVVGCILWDNRCENGLAEVFNWHDNDPQFTACCVQGGYPGAGNVAVDPGFVDPAKGDYRLREDSPCRAMGYTAATSEELPAPVRPPREDEQGRPAQRPPSERATEMLYVRASNAAQPQDGRSWQTAFASLQDALAAAAGHPAEIWVAAGTYKPTAGADRSASFVLHEGLTLYGGFRGDEKGRSERDFQANLTILSGDIGHSDDTSDNSFHVVIGADDATFDGFVVRDGQADGRTYDSHGGGMINYRRAPQSGPRGTATGYSPVVRNCVFTHNHAREGGAVYNYDRGTPVFSDCRFVENSADYGGALVDRVGVRSTMSGCVFENNRARWRAGAVYLDYGARPTFTDCRFTGNRSACHGGALAAVSRASQLEATIAVFKTSTFVGNHAQRLGGAIADFDHSIFGLDRCALSDNQAGQGGGAVALQSRARAVLLDCDLSGNRSDQGPADVAPDETSTVSHNQLDWPDQTAPPRPAGFGPPRR